MPTSCSTIPRVPSDPPNSPKAGKIGLFKTSPTYGRVRDLCEDRHRLPSLPRPWTRVCLFFLSLWMKGDTKAEFFFFPVDLDCVSGAGLKNKQTVGIGLGKWDDGTAYRLAVAISSSQRCLGSRCFRYFRYKRTWENSQCYAVGQRLYTRLREWRICLIRALFNEHLEVSRH